MFRHVVGNSITTIEGYRDEDIQPNALDIRVEKILQVLGTEFAVGDNVKLGRVSIEEPLKHYRSYDHTGPLGWWLKENNVYEIVTTCDVNIADNQCGWVIPRSTLVRSGLFLISGLYDSGYHGKVGGVLHVTLGAAFIQQYARIGQFLLADAEMLKKYNGQYGFGTADDQKYGAKK